MQAYYRANSTPAIPQPATNAAVRDVENESNGCFTYKSDDYCGLLPILSRELGGRDDNCDDRSGVGPTSGWDISTLLQKASSSPFPAHSSWIDHEHSRTGNTFTFVRGFSPRLVSGRHFQSFGLEINDELRFPLCVRPS